MRTITDGGYTYCRNRRCLRPVKEGWRFCPHCGEKMTILNRTKNNDLTLRDRVSRLEGKVSVMLGLTIGTFLGVLGLLLERAFA